MHQYYFSINLFLLIQIYDNMLLYVYLSCFIYPNSDLLPQNELDLLV